MTPEELLGKVHDRPSFVSFVHALAEERELAMAEEQADPARYCLDGARDWKNADIASFLYAALTLFEDHHPNEAPSWSRFAEFLYSGKVIE
ncbi:hypothetical protein [Dyella ginsengisoli]|uniref:hypothetical protein n=1 Tax=Dyella ginsengisoli TaxID=363848 RepID=UPI0009FF098D|nr:hypothetical protein [Dyella ginsengisoli]